MASRSDKPRLGLVKLLNDLADVRCAFAAAGVEPGTTDRVCCAVAAARLAPARRAAAAPGPEWGWRDGRWVPDGHANEPEPTREETTMPRLSDVFHGKTLSASDLDEEGQTFTITDVDVKQFDDGPKLMISLQETDKTFVANKTNSQTIARLYGDDTDEWGGARISLYQTWVDFQGKQVPAIRVKPKKPAVPQRGKPAGKTAAPVTQDEADMDPDEWEQYGRR